VSDEAERTALAWQRTGLAAAMLLLLTAYDGVRLGQPWLSVISAALALALVLFALRRFPTARPQRDSRHAVATTIATLVVLVVATSLTAAAVGVVAFLR
jgi:uncharacterized membrane protein YidH (DUF202 family)